MITQSFEHICSLENMVAHPNNLSACSPEHMVGPRGNHVPQGERGLNYPREQPCALRRKGLKLL
jgi:hypothetical protein